MPNLRPLPSTVSLPRGAALPGRGFRPAGTTHGWGIRVSGVDVVTEALGKMAAFAQRFASVSLVLEDPLPYAYWINYGRYAGGRAGRRKAGPALFFEAGLEAARSAAPTVIGDALLRGGSADAALNALGQQAVAAGRPRIPVVSGNLRDNFRARVGGPRGGSLRRR